MKLNTENIRTLYESIYHESNDIDDACLERLLTFLHSDLTNEEQQVLSLRYGLDGGEPKTQNQASSILGITCEAVR